MRKITRDAVEAFVNGDNFKRDNTEVRTVNNELLMYLHNNLIAYRCLGFDSVFINDAGWQTKTTKERLNGILDAYHSDSLIYQKNYQWYLSRHGEVEEFPSNKWVSI